MDKIISNIGRFFVFIFFTSLLIGLLFGFICSNRIFTINYNPENARNAITKTSDNIKSNGTAFVESFRPESQKYNEDGIYYVEKEKSVSTNPYYSLIIHVIRKGESLADLSSKYKISEKVLTKLNHINNPNFLKPEDEILIPIRRFSEN